MDRSYQSAPWPSIGYGVYDYSGEQYQTYDVYPYISTPALATIESLEVPINPEGPCPAR